MSAKTTDDTKEWQQPQAGSPCWVEIPARDAERLKAFYGDIFPSWEWKSYHVESSEDRQKVQLFSFAEPKGLSGGIVQMPEGCTPTEQVMGTGTTVYYLVDSLETIEERIRECGGTTCLAKTAESSHGWFMNFRDPEGNRFGCYEVRHS